MVSVLIENAYNEKGEIVILDDFDPSKWYSSQEYYKMVHKSSVAQLCWLTISIALVATLLSYTCYLNKKLIFRRPWMPPSGLHKLRERYGGQSRDAYYRYGEDAGVKAGRISRKQSGIVAMRTDLSVDDGASQTGGQRTYKTAKWSVESDFT
jgi:hypothetical protein